MNKENPKSPQIFEGIRILDFCQVIAGSYATTILADMGAEVIKVEQPGSGDALRKVGPVINGKSVFFLQTNRNKKSICIDLKKPEGIDLIRRMVPHFDVITENFKPGVMSELGLGYEDVKKLKKEIIYLSVSGYGHNNKYSKRPAYDNIIQAETGLASLNGFPEHGIPLRSPLSVSDYTSGTYGAFAVSSALYHLKNTGQGQFIDIAMYDALISFMDNTFLICDSKKDEIASGTKLEELGLKSTGNRHPDSSPHGFYKTKDGYVAHTSLTNNMWHKLLGVIGKEELIQKKEYNTLINRKKHWKEIDNIVESWTQLHSSDEVINIFRENRLPCGKVRSIDEVYNDNHNSERGVFAEIELPLAGKLKISNIPIKFSETPVKIITPSPYLGENAYDVLNDIMRFSKEKVDELIEKNVLFINENK